jgi:hypothetical protein
MRGIVWNSVGILNSQQIIAIKTYGLISTAFKSARKSKA